MLQVSRPQLSIPQCDALLSAPGASHELEHVVIDGRIQRVYKNLWPSMAAFFRYATSQFSARTYLVYEDERITYAEVFRRASQAASVYRTVYGVRKGDRVVLAMRNCPEWVISYWACHLLGAVAVAVNAWLRLDSFKHCIILADAKLIVVDCERAAMTERLIDDIQAHTKATGVLVVRSHEAPSSKNKWKGAQNWEDAMKAYTGPSDEWTKEPPCLPDDNCAIFFTSGTTGQPKGVLLSQRAIVSNVLNSVGARIRMILRKGETIPAPDPDAPQKALLIPVPLFHVTGSLGALMSGTFGGARVCLIRKWEPKKVVELIHRENLGMITSVPSMILDLLDMTGEEGFPSLEAVATGGAAANDHMAHDVRRLFVNAIPSQGYGLTETAGGICGFSGEDYTSRPESTGYPAMITDIIIMNTNTGKSLPAGEIGEIWIRSPMVFREYWRNPKETEKVLTKDGWFKTGDLGYRDKEGFLYIKDRAKDMIIRGGENIASISVENALFSDTRVLDCSVVGIPDRRLGELVTAIVVPKESHRGRVTEEELIASVRKLLPAFAVPSMVLVQDEPIERNAAGKVVKTELRKILKKEWDRRKRLETKGGWARAKL